MLLFRNADSNKLQFSTFSKATNHDARVRSAGTNPRSQLLLTCFVHQCDLCRNNCSLKVAGNTEVILFRWDFYLSHHRKWIAKPSTNWKKNLLACLFSWKITLRTRIEAWIFKGILIKWKKKKKKKKAKTLNRCSKFNERYESFDK